MEQNQVVTILESLASGIDPTTGATCHDAFAAPDVVRALTIAAERLKASPARPTPASAGARWTDDEDSLVCREFDEGTTLAEIARRHLRSVGAITLRLVKLGRLDAQGVRVRERVRRGGANGH